MAFVPAVVGAGLTRVPVVWTPPPWLPGPSGWTGLLVAAMAAAVVWGLLERRRWGREHELTHGWRTAYWHLAATARCPLCGTRAERETGMPLSRSPREESYERGLDE